MSFSQVWASLEEDYRAGPGTGRVQRRILPNGRWDFFLALELPSRRRMLVLRVLSTSIVGQPAIPESRGMSVKMRSRDTEPSTAEVELTLTDVRQQEIFNLLIEDLAETTRRAADEQTAVSRFLERLSNWQHLFMRLPSGVLSREEQQGLWGELWSLREVVRPVRGSGVAIRSWRGPLAAAQDIQLPGCALEIKTTTANTLERLMIASERQLETPADVSLALLALSLDARPSHGETLTQIVASLRALAAEAAASNVLDERLALAGYRDEDAEAYNEVGYALRCRRQYRVFGEFPRMTSGNLAPGLSEVRYTIDLNICERFAISETQLASLLGGPL